MTRQPMQAARGLALASALALAAAAQAQSLQAKDIVLTRLGGVAPATAAAAPARAAVAASQGMAVSVLVLGEDGLLYPRAATAPFKTGERFRLRVLPTVDGTLVLANTSAQGSTVELLRMTVRAEQETLIPSEPDQLLQLAGPGGEEVLHLRLFPAGQPVQGAAAPQLAAKDIRLVTQSTASASYVAGPSDQSLYTRVVVGHQ